MRRIGGLDPHTLAGAYSMDAVDEDDRIRFERHLASCESCREEVRGLREATARLAAARAVRPPDRLRHAVVQAAERIRQMPPIMDQAGGHGRARTTPSAWFRLRVAGWRPWLAASLGGAVIAAAVVLGVIAFGTQHRLDQTQSHAREIAAVLSAPDATMRTARVAAGGTATVVMSHHMRTLVFMAADLRTLPPGRSYELWLMGPVGARSAGMLHAGRQARMAAPMVVSGLAPGESVAVTIEPAGGSPRPTTRPVVLLSLG